MATKMSHFERIAQLGREIYIYNNIKTNQTLYSLQRSLNNAHALRQFVDMGKGSRPKKLRKDMWTPLASVHLPSPAIGQKVFHHLRQFKLLHETQWDDPELWKLDKKTKRKEKLMDQKANSIADLAVSLKMELEKAKDVKPGDVIVRWKNVFDAEYSDQWPKEVVHDTFAPPDVPIRHTAPPLEVEEELEGVVAEVTAGEAQTEEVRRV